MCQRWDCCNVHRVESPKDEGEASNSLEESASLGILLHGHGATVDSKEIDNDEVSSASHGIVSPLGTLVSAEGSEETGKDHDEISNDGDEDAGTIESGEEGKIQEQEWGGDTPVDVTGPVDLTLNGVGGIRGVLVGFLDHGGDHRDTITRGHGEVGDGSEGSDEGSQDVEHAFLL